MLAVKLGDINHKDLSAAKEVIAPKKRKSDLTAREKEAIILGAWLTRLIQDEDDRQRIEELRRQGQT